MNVNPFGPPESVRQAVRESVEYLTNYPDSSCQALRKALSEKLAVRPDYLIFGNGAAELIFALVQAVRPKKALLAAPGFAEYEAALKAADCEIVFYPLSPERNFQPGEDFMEWITDETDLIFLCNPNNPTGVETLGNSCCRLQNVRRNAGQCWRWMNVSGSLFRQRSV